MKSTLRIVSILVIGGFSIQLCHSQFGPQQIITIENLQPTAVYAADIDGDGFVDVLSGGIEDDQLAWQKNLDGQGNFGNPNFLSNTVRPYKVETADINGDGFLDIWTTSGGDDFLTWFEHLDGTGNFADQDIISNEGNEASFADIDNDGDLDVFVTSDTALFWKENVNGSGFFGSNQFIWVAPSRTFLDVNAIDIDNDGDIDVMLALDDGSFWYENLDGEGNFSGQNLIDNTVEFGHEYLLPADIDNDGDMDAVVSERNNDSVSWYENIDGLGTYGPEQIISGTISDFIAELRLADINHDGNIDVLAALQDQSKFVWFENLNGTGSFGNEQIITTEVDNPTAIFAADLNGDSRLDVLTASITDHKIAWYPNQIPLGQQDIPIISLALFPNPVHDRFTIEANTTINSYRLHDYNGRTLKKVVFTSETFQDEIMLHNNIASGIYFITIHSGTNRQTIKFLKL